jgi:hypothetical protein
MVSWRVASWSDDAIVERCERELRAWRERILVCEDCARDWGSVVVRSDGRSDRSRDKYFPRPDWEEMCGLSSWSLPLPA